MCGIAGLVSLDLAPIQNIEQRVNCMSKLISHRGPDGKGVWVNKESTVAFGHRRLSIIDLSSSASQPMKSQNGNIIIFNGEIYNFHELRSLLSNSWSFRTNSDTECILAAYDQFGEDCVNHFKGMFAFALWDERKKLLFCARDRFGMKPFYYAIIKGVFYFASEAKAILPFLPEIKTNKEALAEYLTFQYTIGEKTLFENIKQLMPANLLILKNEKLNIKKYWDVEYKINHTMNFDEAATKVTELLKASVKLHGQSDVPVASYISGGIDSSLIFSLAQDNSSAAPFGFHGRFSEYPGYDESSFAKFVVKHDSEKLHIAEIGAEDFRKYFEKVIYHLDFPVAGPGSFAQYMVSKLAAKHAKVVLGGQGGDEIFGGYARYIIAYLEQCLKAAIDGNYKNGNFVVTIESIIPNLVFLKEYKNLIKNFWSKGLFEPMDKRYFDLINRSADMYDEIEWSGLNMSKVFEDFSIIFNNPANTQKEAYFDKMTHFDFKCQLPALLQVEDRMSMAHGIESRLPFLDHHLVEFVSTIPADIKFKGGNAKNILKKTYANIIPQEVLNRTDKMGFPVPLKEWFDNELKEFSESILKCMADKKRDYFNSGAILKNLGKNEIFSRKIWGLLSLEIWYQQFHDKAEEWKKLGKDFN